MNLIQIAKNQDTSKALEMINLKDVNIDETELNDALLVASQNNDVEMIKILIEAESKIRLNRPIVQDKDTRLNDIAIVGMACRFPNNSNTIKEYWQNLKNGFNGITLIPEERWRIEDYYDPDVKAQGKMYTKHGGFITQPIRNFDANFFRISPREAEMMDPQQRLLLEVSWEAFENGGIVVDRFLDNNTGVFIGSMTHDYSDMMGEYKVNHNSFVGSGNGFSVMSGRLSYFFGLQGPSMTIDTACSSSLVTTHYAIHSLKNGECDMALTGGVNLMISPNVTINCCKAEMLSKNGQCKTFDIDADGYVRSEGCGILILKRLNDAIKDSNKIFGVIKGSAINQDGATSGLTVPNKKAQSNVIKQALKDAKLETEHIDYIEAHGTGTSLGDPIEINALKDVFDKQKNWEKTLYVGSVKTNIGHLEAAAGSASLIKVILSLNNSFIPAHVKFETLNPKINIKKSRLRITSEGIKWEKTNRKRRAGISSFGFSGTNAHVIIEEAPEIELDVENILKNQWLKMSKQYNHLFDDVECTKFKEYKKTSHLIVLSARNEKALIDLQKKYIEYLKESREDKEEKNFEQDMCFTASVGRNHFSEERIAFLFNNLNELENNFDFNIKENNTIDSNNRINGIVKRSTKKNKNSSKVAFLFTGQGSQYARMSYDLFESNLVFRTLIINCDRILSKYLNSPKLVDVLYGCSNEYLNDTEYAQVTLFSLEYCLACLWRSFGIECDIVMGHSVGEYVASVLSGCISLEDGIKLTYMRGKLMKQTQNGKMIAVLFDLSKIEKLIQQNGNKIDVAGINSQKQIVLSGAQRDIDQFAKLLIENGCTSVRELNTNKAFHSRYMEPILDEFDQYAKTIQFKSDSYKNNSIIWISTLDGLKEKNSNFTLTSKHWTNQIRNKVDFMASVKILIEMNVTCCIEIGPNQILTKLAQQCLNEYQLDNNKDNILWLNTLKPKTNDMFELQFNLAKWYVNGGQVDWMSFHSSYISKRIVIPTYAFQRQSYWIHINDKNNVPRISSTVQISNSNNVLPDLFINKWSEFSPNNDNLNVNSTRLIFLSYTLSTDKSFIKFLIESFESQLIFVHSNSQFPFQDEENIYIDFSFTSYFDLFNLEKLKSGFEILIFFHKDEFTSYIQYSPLLFLLVNITKQLNQLKLRPNIFIITSNALVISTFPSRFNYNQASSIGLIKALTLEYLGLMCHIDIDSMSDNVLKFIQYDIQENLVAYRESKWYVPRLNLYNLDKLDSRKFNSNGAFVITGGLGAIGLKLTEWLIEKGVKHIYLLSRRNPNKEIEKIIKLKRPNTTIATISSDVTELVELEKILLDIHYQFDLKGIIHAAGNPDIKLLKNLDIESMKKVLDPKVIGTWNLHHVTTKHNIQLNYFILFSSSASIIPSIGQSHYSAANSFLDQMVIYRSSIGLPGLSINWGLWSDIGVATDKNFNRRLEKGVNAISSNDNLKILDKILSSNYQSQIIIMNINWKDYNQNVNIFQKKYLSNVLPKNQKQIVDKKFQIEDIFDLVRQVVSNVSHINEKDLSLEQRFAEYGIDSLMSSEIGSLIQDKLENTIQLPPTLSIEYDSIIDLSNFLINELNLKSKQELDPINYLREQIQMSSSDFLFEPILLSDKKKIDSNLPIIFFIHTIMGSVYFYNALIDYLKNDFIIYGINNPNFSHPDKHFKSIEEMATCYVQVIINCNPLGPYRIIGLSFAGAVAYEIGRQLVNLEKNVHSIIMLDTVKPSLNHLELPSREKAAFVMGQVSKDIDDYYQAEIENNQKILNNYEPKSYEARIVLIKARGLDSVSLSLKNLDDPFNDWLCVIVPEIYSISGSHFSLFDKGYALLTAEKIKYIISSLEPPLVLKDQSLSVLDRLFLHSARESDFYFISWLIENGANINATDGMGRNALHWAAINDDISLVHFLFSNGTFDIQQEDNEGKDATILSYEYKNLQVFSYLGNILFNKTKIKTFSIRDAMNLSKKSINSAFDVNHEWKRREWLEILENFNKSGQDSFDNENKPMISQVYLVKKIQNLKKNEGKKHNVPLVINLESHVTLDVLWKISDGDSSKCPIFFIHAASGLSLPYMKISIPNRTVYGISNPYFNCSDQFDSIASMSKCYIDLIKNVQPNGPYILAGWSLGGIIAVNMASKLSNVQLVIMIDSVNHLTKPANELDTKIAIERLLERKTMSVKSLEYNNAIKKEYFRTAKLLHNYKSPIYEGNVLLLKACQPEVVYLENSDELRAWKINISKDPFCGWKNILKNLDIRSVPGEHHDLFENQPSIKAINNELKNVIEKIDHSSYQVFVDKNFLYAVSRNDEHLIDLFLNQKCNLELTDEENRTALHWAVLNNNFKLVKQLEFNDLKDLYEHTPIEYALELGFLSLYKLLKLKL